MSQHIGFRGCALLGVSLLTSGCGGTPPALHYYVLVPEARAPASERPAPATLSVEALAVDAAYDTERIVYRVSNYRLDYYNYHLWSAHPGLHVADCLRKGYARTALNTLIEMHKGRRLLANIAPDNHVSRYLFASFKFKLIQNTFEFQA